MSEWTNLFSPPSLLSLKGRQKCFPYVYDIQFISLVWKLMCHTFLKQEQVIFLGNSHDYIIFWIHNVLLWIKRNYISSFSHCTDQQKVCFDFRYCYIKSIQYYFITVVCFNLISPIPSHFVVSLFATETDSLVLWLPLVFCSLFRYISAIAPELTNHLFFFQLADNY